MIRGIVTLDREAVLRLKLWGGSGLVLELDAVVDTGYSEELSLPQEWIDTLGLVQVRVDELCVMGGQVYSCPVYDVTVDWDGQPRTVSAHLMEGTPLVGMAMLLAHRLTVDVMDGGEVQIAPLAPTSQTGRAD